MISTDLQSSKVKGHRYCFLTAELSGKIDAFLVRAHRYGLAANILTISELFDSVAQDFSAKFNRLTTVFIT